MKKLIFIILFTIPISHNRASDHIALDPILQQHGTWCFHACASMVCGTQQCETVDYWVFNMHYYQRPTPSFSCCEFGNTFSTEYGEYCIECASISMIDGCKLLNSFFKTSIYNVAIMADAYSRTPSPQLPAIINQIGQSGVGHCIVLTYVKRYPSDIYVANFMDPWDGVIGQKFIDPKSTGIIYAR